MKGSVSRSACIALAAAIFLLSAQLPANADLQAGQRARLFSSIDENLEHVDMADMIDGLPLVLVVGSCS